MVNYAHCTIILGELYSKLVSPIVAGASANFMHGSTRIKEV